MKASVDPGRLDWYVSTYTGGQGNCVQVADLPEGSRALRDSKHPHQGFFTLPAAEWSAFVRSSRQEQL
ncbi:DUF397 domain-containing protein [Nocardiopsis composta]